MAWVRRTIKSMRLAQETKAPESSSEPTSRREFFTGLPKHARKLGKWWGKLPLYQRTALETVFVTMAAYLAYAITSEKRLRELNTEYWKTFSRAEKINALLPTTVIHPVLEEIVYRVFPSELIDEYMPKEKGKITWKFGIPISLIFAAAHINRAPPGYDKKYVPAGQFIFGLYSWNLMRRRNGFHSTLAHGEYNALVMLVEEMLARH